MTDATKATKKNWISLAILMLPVLLVSIDNTVLSLALPKISQTLNPNSTQLLWVVDSYSLVLAGLLVSMGSLGDKFGRKKLLLIGSAGFALISIMAAYAPNIETLIISRVIMGFFGAMLMPATLSLIRNIFKNREQRRLAIAIWAACFSVGAALGPIVGGILLEYFWWGSVFLIAVPVMIILLILAPFMLPESRSTNPEKINILSIFLLFCSIVPIVYAIKVVAHDGITTKSILLALVGIIVGIIFVKIQLRSKEPLLDLQLFKSRVFTGAININLFSMAAFVGAILFISQHLQLVLELSPLEAALKLTPGLILMTIASLGVVWVVRYIKPHIVVVSSVMLASLGYFILAITTGNIETTNITIAFSLLGVGIGAAETLANDFIISAVPAEKAGAASGISETAYEIGVVAGASIIGGILMSNYRNNVILPPGLDPDQQYKASETLGGALNVAETLPQEEAQHLLEVAREAFDSGAIVTSIVGMSIMLAVAILGWFSLKNSHNHDEHK